jgi:DNA-binding HxlR family transcriptional regulator
MLAAPLNVPILQVLSRGKKQQSELRNETGMPAQTTLRAQLKRLVQAGAIAKHRRNRFPGVLEYELTPAGRELLCVAGALTRWLELAPHGPPALGGNSAKAAIKAFAEGWSTTMLHSLATGPLTLTELNRIIHSLSYPSLERRLAAMRLAALVEAQTGNGRGTPYAVTAWAREGVGPLAAAARWERLQAMPSSPPIGQVEAESLLLLALPLLDLPTAASGSCRMAVELPERHGPQLVGVVISIEDGRVRACSTSLRETADAWAIGSANAWLDALVSADTAAIETGGDGLLARTLLDGLHRALFGATSGSCS